MKKLPWPEKENPIISITYKLMTDFDTEGNPIYGQGSVQDDREFKVVQNVLEPLHPSPATITSITMGKVNLKLSNGELITLRPVFHPSLDVYKDLFKVENFDFNMPASFAGLLNKWRRQLLNGNPQELK